ncbi:hypothetical protein PsAD46_03955 [Pseudovibrio sp. Ad46]|nr:hypothetical protein PsAD46_03955 [Pseudovibrio sp. Ad46]
MESPWEQNAFVNQLGCIAVRIAEGRNDFVNWITRNGGKKARVHLVAKVGLNKGFWGAVLWFKRFGNEFS